jgi:two-component system, NarL family, nitrate/nitrite response regulator NarL
MRNPFDPNFGGEALVPCRQPAELRNGGAPEAPDKARACDELPVPPEPLRTFIATGVAIYEHALVHVLGSYGTIRVVGSARTVADTVASVQAVEPDVVLLDVSLPDALEVIRALRTSTRRIPVLGLAVNDDERDVLACVEAGIAACVMRDGSLADLVTAMRSAIQGEALCSPRIVGALFRRVADLAERGVSAVDASALTAREREIVALIDRGLSNKEIARHLGIELPTVKNHVHHILAKLSVGRRGEAAARLRHDYVEPTASPERM